MPPVAIDTNQINGNYLNILTGEGSVVVAPITNINVAVNTVVDPVLFPTQQEPAWPQPHWLGFN